MFLQAFTVCMHTSVTTEMQLARKLKTDWIVKDIEEKQTQTIYFSW